jgi:hypothetical protein
MVIPSVFQTGILSYRYLIENSITFLEHFQQNIPEFGNCNQGASEILKDATKEI